jgi:capsular polysaccharide biosynthesis protein
MDQVEQILSSGWTDAILLACVSGCRVEDQGSPPSFRLNPGASIVSKQQYALESLQDELLNISPDANAFLIHDAVVLGNGFLVHSPDGLVRETRYLANNLERRIELSLRDEPVILDDSVTWIIAGNASSRHNYWHWFAQMLPGVLHSRDFAQSLGKTDIGVVTGPLTDWQIESLAVVGIPRNRVVEINVFQNARAKTLIYSSLLSDSSVFANNRYRKELSKTFVEWAVDAKSKDEKLIISRKDTKKRPLLNEDAVHAALISRGFRVVTGGTTTLREQIQAFHAASIIVAPHGAGSTNVLFGRPGAAYVELAQLSYPNGGPLSLCKTSEMLTWLDLFEDDGKGQSTEGWTAPTDVVLATVINAESKSW